MILFFGLTLFAGESTVKLTDENFKKEIENYKGYALVDFWAPWCGPCRILGPVIEKMGKTYKGSLKVGKVNVDNNESVSKKYGVRSIPYVVLFKDGKKVDSFVGAIPEKNVVQFIEKHIK